MRREIAVLPLQAAALAVAYYLSARIGFAFQAPGVPQSVMWLPNSLLLAALLLTPPRLWPVFLAAAFPSHLLVAWHNAAPLPTLALLYLTNCIDAILGASAVRLISRGEWRLNSLRALLIFFVFGAVLGPLLVSFVDASITVLTGWTTHYWSAYQTRLRANTLTNVIVVPAIIGAFEARWWWRKAPPKRYLEAGALLASMLLVSALVFSRSADFGPGLLYLPVPILVWAAVRFGPGLTGISLVTVAFFSSWYGLRAVGVFAGADPARNIVALQVFLLCIAIPLLCLAMVVQEREVESRKLIASRDEIRKSVNHIRDLAGRLISAQEEERRRIARELHDDVGQYVADMAVTMSAMKRVPAVRDAGLETEFQRLYEQTSNLFENVRALSHELHPSILRHAGLLAATGALCQMFGRRHGIAVDFEPQAIEPVSDEVSLSAYRVAQEALNNVAAHSRASTVRVSLERTGNRLSLSVVDNGRGFDTTAEHSRRGLGLVSMEERVRLVHGVIDVESSPGGTRITASFPVETLA